MIESPMPRQNNALVPPDRAAAYEAVGWRVVNDRASTGHGDTRVYLRWEHASEPVIPAGDRTGR